MSVPEVNLRGSALTLNLFSNLANLAIGLIIGIWFTPFLIRNLGLENYGLIPLAVSITSYLGILTLLIDSATGRFMTIALQKNDFDSATKIFNTVLLSLFLLMAAVVAIAFVMLPTLLNFLRTPAGMEKELYSLFLLTIFAFAITTLQSPFEISTFCLNRFELRNLIAITGSLLKVGIVALLFFITIPRIWHVGAGIIISSIGTFFLSIIISKRLLKNIRISCRQWNLSIFRQLWGTSLWIFISQVGTILIINIDLLLVNKFFSAKDAGAYASILQWSTLMRTLATAIAGVFAPTILRLYANNDHSEMVRYTKSSIRLIAVLLLLPIPLIFGFSKSILSLWIGNDVGAYAPLLMIMLIHLPISLSYLPLHNINIATNSVRLPGIVQIMAGALNLILAIVLCQIPRLGMYGLAIAGAAVLFLRNVVFTPLYAARVLNRPLFTFMKQVLPISAFSILACIASYFLASLTHPISWTGLAISSGPFLIAYCFVAYFFVLNRSERLRFMDILTKFRNRIWRTNAS